MRPQLLMGAMGVFIVGTLMCCICSGRWLLNGEINIINALASFNMMSVSAGGLWSVPKMLGSFFSAIITALSWNYPFLSSDWALFVKIPLWLVSIGVVWGLIEVAINVIQGIVSGLRNLIGG